MFRVSEGKRVYAKGPGHPIVTFYEEYGHRQLWDCLVLTATFQQAWVEVLDVKMLKTGPEFYFQFTLNLSLVKMSMLTCATLKWTQEES